MRRLLILLASASLGITANAEDLVDQELDPSYDLGSGPPSPDYIYSGQTFIPTVSNLTAFDLFFTGGAGNSYGFSVIRWSDKTNPLTEWMAQIPTTADWSHFILPEPVELVPGEKYAILIRRPNDETPSWNGLRHRVTWSEPPGEHYPNGGLVYVGGWWGESGRSDLVFRTYYSPVRDVNIDIKPGSDPNCININGHGVIPVAILGSATFDVSMVDQSTLSFGGLAVHVRGNKGPFCGSEDTNDDGFVDLVCQFQDDPINWTIGDGSATLTGATLDGMPIEGTDSICVVP
jgi:hypothetical protein